jgi:uncharacterized protein YjbI with pentapeptide repeats
LREANLRFATFGCEERHKRPLESLRDWLVPHPTEGRAEPICTNLSGAHLDGADLRNSRFGGRYGRPTLKFVSLNGANLRDTDLSFFALDGAELGSADLAGANLAFANLTGAVLAKANLAGANLREADLSFALLNRAYLDAADLQNAMLVAADLTGASLIRANLTAAKLIGARLRDARLWQASVPHLPDLGWTDLTNIGPQKPSDEETARLSYWLEELTTTASPELDSLRSDIKSLVAGKNVEEFDLSWKSLGEALRRSTDTADYRRALSIIFRDFGCAWSGHSIAIDYWARIWRLL